MEKTVHSAVGALCGVTTSKPFFHISFDDGPHPEVTPRILDVLEETATPATFFLQTDRVVRFPSIVREILERGHEIGHHTRTHPRLTEMPWSRLRDEISLARKDLEEVAGREVRWFRPPYGAHNLRSLSLVGSGRMKTLLWTVDSRDWKGLTPADPLERSRHGLGPGGILLMHDVPMEWGRDDAELGYIPKHELLRMYMEELDRRSLRPVSLTDLLEAGRPLRKAKLG